MLRQPSTDRVASGARAASTARTASARTQVPATPSFAAHLTADAGGMTLHNVTQDGANGLLVAFNNDWRAAYIDNATIGINFVAPFYCCVEWLPGFAMSQAGTPAAVIDITQVSDTLFGIANHILLNDFGVSIYGSRAGMYPQVDKYQSAIQRPVMPNFIVGDTIRQVYAFDPARGFDFWTSMPAYNYIGHALDASGGGLTSVFEGVAPLYFGIGSFSNNGLTASLHAREFVMAQGWPTLDINSNPTYLANPTAYVAGMIS